MLVDYTYYTDTYNGQTMDQAEFDKWNQRAEDDIFNNSIMDVEDLETWEVTPVKNAICAQIEYYFFNGDTYNDIASDSETIGKYSRSGGGSSSNGGASQALSPRCRQYLSKTNVLCRVLHE